jgi:hypothetical protein
LRAVPRGSDRSWDTRAQHAGETTNHPGDIQMRSFEGDPVIEPLDIIVIWHIKMVVGFLLFYGH